MLFAVSLSLFLFALLFWALSRRNRYWNLRRPHGNVKNKIIKLPVKHITHNKLKKEIKIFNALSLVAPTCGGVPVIYTELIAALAADPKYRPNGDPYERLLFGYACFVLSKKITDEIINRQLRKNLLFLFAQKKKIVKKIDAVWTDKKYYVNAPVPFKVFNTSAINLNVPDFQTEKPLKMTVCDSYIIYRNPDLTVRRFDNYFALNAETEQKITFTAAADKADFDVKISRGTCTCRHIITGETKTYVFRGNKIRLSTSACEKTDALEIYLVFSGAASVSVDGGAGGLLRSGEIDFNRRTENIVTSAYMSKFVTGEKLRERYKTTATQIPSLALLTAVYEIRDADDFLSAVDNFPCYKKAAKLFGGFNLVFLYSSGSALAADLVAGFIKQGETAGLAAAGVFIFFVDRVTAPADAIYFLTKMAKDSGYTAPPVLSSGHRSAVITETASKSFPYTRTVTLQNTGASVINVSASVPIVFPAPTIVSASGQTVTATGLYSGRTAVYKLPDGASVLIGKEYLTDRVAVTIKTKLAGFEQKKFTIQRNESAADFKEQRKNFIGSLDNITVKTADKELNKIFALPVSGGEAPQILLAVKAAYKNVDRTLLISVLSGRNTLTADVWEFLLTKIAGLRLLRGNVHLLPNINIMGDFTVDFTCNGKPYSFNTHKASTRNKIVQIRA